MKQVFPHMVIILLACAACVYAATADVTDTESVAPSSLIPQNAAVFVQLDGVAKHRAALQQTAKWQAFEETGLRARIFDILELLASTGGDEAARLARTTLDRLYDHGVSLGVAASGEEQPLAPLGVLVFHGAGDLKQDILNLFYRTSRRAQDIVQITQKSGRNLVIIVPPDAPLPDLEIAFWSEGEHLVLAAGVKASERVIALAEGQQPNVTQHRLWKSTRSADSFTVNQVSWIDISSLVETASMFPLPPTPQGEQLTLQEILTVLGLDNLEALTMNSGYQGKVTWEQLRVLARDPRRGLLSLIDQRNMQLSELPLLPPDSAFAATTFDIPRAVDMLLQLAEEGLPMIDPRMSRQFTQGLTQFRNMLGEPQDVLSAGLGDVFCGYTESGAMPFGFAPVLAVQVKDRTKLTQSLDFLSMIAQSVPDLREVTIDRQLKNDALWYTIKAPGMPVIPVVLVTDKWLVAGPTPATALAFLKRQDGKLKSWQPGPEHQEAFAELPDEFSGIMVTDPRRGYEQLMSLLPLGLNLLETTLLPELSREAGRELTMPFGVEDVPLTEELTAPMFPNISMTWSTAGGVVSLSRNSVPSNPVGSVGTTATVPALAALLLPAVSQAREAARRTQSRNELKQIGLAMHNFHDVHNAFPQGTIEGHPGELDEFSLPPEERLGWATQILPYIDQANVFQHIDFHQGWADQQQVVAEAAVPAYQNPNLATAADGSIHFVGIAGVGEDAPMGEIGDPGIGVFGYNRRTRIQHITDGTSNTIMVAETATPANFLRGTDTIRAFTQAPYVDGPDGFGGVYSGGMHVLFADGSVRFLSEYTDADIVEALSTIAGGEIINGF